VAAYRVLVIRISVSGVALPVEPLGVALLGRQGAAQGGHYICIVYIILLIIYLLYLCIMNAVLVLETQLIVYPQA
jgi:hypothetical protein